MKLAIVLGLALALSAQPVEMPCKSAVLDGHWWLAASACDRQLYLKAFTDGGGTFGSEAAIERWYTEHKALDVPVKQAIHNIWGSADTNK